MEKPLVYAAVVTPFDGEGRIDAESARRCYGWGFAQGLDGIMLFGSMGEGALYPDGMARELARAAADAAAEYGKTLIFCLQGTGPLPMRERMAALADIPHDFWSILPPAGMGRPADPARFFAEFADAADRPVFYYHNPAANGLNPTPDQWRRLLAHPKLAGVKNSAGGMRTRRELLRLCDERRFVLLEGDEWAVDEALWLGGGGVLLGSGLLASRPLMALVRAAGDGDWATAQARQADLLSIFHAVYGEDLATWCVGHKYALQRMGLIRTSHCLVDAQRELPADTRARIDAFLAAHPDWFQTIG